MENSQIFVRFSFLGSLINEGGDSVTDFEKAYKQYFSDVYLYILRLSGNEHIAEEITSDTFCWGNLKMEKPQRLADVDSQTFSVHIFSGDLCITEMDLTI